MERTKEYKAILKTCKVRLGKDGGVPKKVKKNHSKSEQSGGRPLTRAIEVRQSISELKSYIVRNAAEYVGIGVFLRQSDSGISDSDRAVIDAEVQSFVMVCHNAIQMLAAELAAVSDAGKVSKHEQAVVDSLTEYLAAVVRHHESTRLRYKKQSQDAAQLSRSILVDVAKISGFRRRRQTSTSAEAGPLDISIFKRHSDGDEKVAWMSEAEDPSDEESVSRDLDGSNVGATADADHGHAHDNLKENVSSEMNIGDIPTKSSSKSKNSTPSTSKTDSPRTRDQVSHKISQTKTVRRRQTTAVSKAKERDACGATVDWARQALASAHDDDVSNRVDEGMRATIMQEMKLRSFADDVLRAEAKVLEVSKLQSEFTQQLSQQSELVQTILHDTTAAQDNVSEGNKHIRKAMEDSNTLRNGVIVFVLMCAFCLFVLEIASS